VFNVVQADASRQAGGPETRSQIERTRVNSYIPQHQVVIQHMQSGYGAGFGLVGAIVDTSVNTALASSAEKRAQKLREKIHDLDVRTSYWKLISNSVTETAWLKVFKSTGTLRMWPK